MIIGYGIGCSFAEHDAAEQEWLDGLPKCDQCGEPIQDTYYWDFGNDKWCEECLNEYRRMNTSV